MSLTLPPVGTSRLLELVSPYAPDDYIAEVCPRQFTGGRRHALRAAPPWRPPLLGGVTSTHSLNLRDCKIGIDCVIGASSPPHLLTIKNRMLAARFALDLLSLCVRRLRRARQHRMRLFKLLMVKVCALPWTWFWPQK